jgi:Fe-S-cluster containining protein
MGNRIHEIRPVYCEYIPHEIEPGVLYISKEYKVTVHLCACGCGVKSALPLTPTNWTLTEENGLVSLTPSIGNWSWERPHYHAHYYITKNKIV